MSQGSKFAMALVFYFLAGVALFVAFHPNGLKNADGTPVTNLAEVVQWYMNLLGHGSQSAGTTDNTNPGNNSGGSGGGGTSAT